MFQFLNNNFITAPHHPHHLHHQNLHHHFRTTSSIKRRLLHSSSITPRRPPTNYNSNNNNLICAANHNSIPMHLSSSDKSASQPSQTTTSTTILSSSTSPASSSNAVGLGTQLSQFGAGALAGLVNTLILSPLDVVKTRLQAQNVRYTGPVHALQSMMREEGLRSYYRGLSASLWAFVPNWAIYWYTYEMFKRAYTPKDDITTSSQQRRRRSSPIVHVLSAVSAGGITAVTTAPFWTLKSRLQVDMSVSDVTQRRYRSVPHGFRTIIKEEGISGLYKGLTPTLLGLGHVAIQFPLYEYLKSQLAKRRFFQPQQQYVNNNNSNSSVSNNNQQQLHAGHVLVASSLSKIVASAVFYPHEVVRTRIQIDDSVVRSSSEMTRVVKLFRDIIRKDGAKGLYRGFGANLVRTVPACMLTFTSYELAKRFAEVQSLKHRRAEEQARNKQKELITLSNTSSSSPSISSHSATEDNQQQQQR